MTSCVVFSTYNNVECKNILYLHLSDQRGGCHFMTKKASNAVAKVLEKVASKSVKMAADSRCMYIYHQPKQPAGVKEFRNK